MALRRDVAAIIAIPSRANSTGGTIRIAVFVERDGRRAAISRRKYSAAITTTTMTAAIAKYTRRSAAISVRIGMTLDDGARMRKNQAPKNPNHRQLAVRHAINVATPAIPSTTSPMTAL